MSYLELRHQLFKLPGKFSKLLRLVLHLPRAAPDLFRLLVDVADVVGDSG
jgi:hypothetical protein